MKKSFFLFSLIFLLAYSLYGLELKKEFKLDKFNNQSYTFIETADYDTKTDHLVLVTPIKNMTSNTMQKMSDKRFYGVFMFTNTGKLLGKVGKFNSYDKNGIISVYNARIIDGKINLTDGAKNKLLIFSNKKPFQYLFSVNEIMNPIWGLPNFIKNNTAFFKQTATSKIDIKKNKRVINHYNIAAVGKVVDSEIPTEKKVINVKRIYSFKDYFNSFWNDKKLLKNKFIKKYIKEVIKYQTKKVTCLELESSSIGPFFSSSTITFGDKENFFIANYFGTEIKKYNFNGDSLDVFKVNKYADYKEKEMNIYKAEFIKKVRNRKQAKKYKSKLSYLYRIVYDSKNNNIIMFYYLKDIFQKVAGLPKATAYLLVYSLDKRKAISDFIPIDFFPVKIDSEKRELIGLNLRNDDIYLQFYKWEY